MGRIRKGYETRFRSLLEQVGARRLEKGIGWLITAARKRAGMNGIGFNEGLELVYEGLLAKPSFRALKPVVEQPRFFCDAGLGGLARWLRGAGYQSYWQAGIEDGALLREAQLLSAIILTTDSGIMERRLVRDRIIQAFWLPPTLKIPQQLARVFREFKLTRKDPRCMTCGGELTRVEKESLREQIPPKTYRWLDEYFRCRSCGKLFWHGTHWQQIHAALGRMQPV